MIQESEKKFARFSIKIRNLDDLHHRHTEYLNKAIFRSLLNKKASPVMKIICDIFSLALKLHTQLMSAPWQQHPETGHVVHPAYGAMCLTMKTFKDCSGFLFTSKKSQLCLFNMNHIVGYC